MKTIVVTGTDTEVGKTFVSCLLIKLLRQQKLVVGAWKPVCSGSSRDDAGEPRWDDVEQLAAALDYSGDTKLICPQRFHAPVAPNVAAGLQGDLVDDSLLMKGPQAWSQSADVVVVEGAGGLLSPLSDSKHTADLAAQLAAPVVIVAANRLGVINHTMLTVEAVRARSLTIAAIVLNDATVRTPDESRSVNARELQRLLPEETVLTLVHNGSELLDRDAQRWNAASLL